MGGSNHACIMRFSICVFAICDYLAYMELNVIPVVEAGRNGEARRVEWRKGAKEG